MYNGRPYTACGYNNLYVNNFGIGAVHYVMVKMSQFTSIKELKFIKWHKRKSDNKKYIYYNRQACDLDWLIGRYCGDRYGFKGDNGQSWDISYVDGNPDHCYQSNLEWVPRPHEIDSTTGMRKMRLCLKDETVDVFENGDVYRGSQKERYVTSMFDSDTDLWFACTPQLNFHCHGKYYDMDDIMTRANFVKGDNRDYLNPVILHIDNDYMNFASDNLEWCEESDPRYREYLKKSCDDQEALSASLNPNGMTISKIGHRNVAETPISSKTVDDKE